MLRSLKKTDYERYRSLIGSDISQQYFDNFITHVLNHNHQIIVIQDSSDNLIGTGTLLIEQKLTYGGCKMGHIENILIQEDVRGKGYGERIVKNLLEVARTEGCYRVDLNCHPELENFYRKNGFDRGSVSMNVYFRDNFKPEL